MKKFLICLIALCVICLVSCENYTTRNWGGTMTINVEPGYKVTNATFKETEIWYFPNEFDGYVNCRSRRISGGTRDMRNHVIAQLQRRRWEGSYTDKVYDASDMSDILMVFEDYNNYINK